MAEEVFHTVAFERVTCGKIPIASTSLLERGVYVLELRSTPTFAVATVFGQKNNTSLSKHKRMAYTHGIGSLSYASLIDKDVDMALNELGYEATEFERETIERESIRSRLNP